MNYSREKRTKPEKWKVQKWGKCCKRGRESEVKKREEDDR